MEIGVLDAHSSVPEKYLDAHSDANWAGCRRSRKSTSGGTIALGAHLIKAYSKTQAVVAKSSAESELYGIIRASTESLGVCTLLEDLGMPGMRARIGVDANAAMGITQRQGLNKLRHVEVDFLWLQEQQARRLLPLRKVPGPRNPSDMMTKHIPVAAMELYLEQLGLVYVSGRADVAQKLHSVGENGETAPEKKTGRFDLNTPEGRKAKAEVRKVDSWLMEGQDGRWIRTHRSARIFLFTPYKVAGGPGKAIHLKKLRITRGRFFNTGKQFKIIDDWSLPANAHRVLEHAWVGTTHFREAAEYIDDDDSEDANDLVGTGTIESESKNNIRDTYNNTTATTTGSSTGLATAGSRNASGIASAGASSDGGDVRTAGIGPRPHGEKFKWADAASDEECERRRLSACFNLRSKDQSFGGLSGRMNSFSNPYVQSSAPSASRLAGGVGECLSGSGTTGLGGLNNAASDAMRYDATRSSGWLHLCRYFSSRFRVA